MAVESALSRTADVVPPEPNPRPPGGTAGANTNETLAAVYLGGLIVLLGGVFVYRLAYLWEVWKEPTYSHGLLVLILSGGIAWHLGKKHPRTEAGNLPAGLVWLVGGGVLFGMGLLIQLPPLDFVALIASLYGLALLVGGRTWARTFRFPILFLVFLFPLPVSWTQALATGLQDVVTTLAAPLLNLFIPTHRVGNFLEMPGETRLEVGEACSGLRTMLAFAALAAVFVYFFARTRLQAVLLVLAFPVIAVLANLFRVLLMATLLLNLGSWSISTDVYSVPGLGISNHDLIGLFTFAAGVGLYLAFHAWLMRLLPVNEAATPCEPAGEAARPVPLGRMAPAFGMALACMLVVTAAQAALSFHLEGGHLAPPPPLPKDTLSRVPVSLGAWSGKGNTDPATLPTSQRDYLLKADDGLSRAYVYEGDDASPGLTCWLWMIHTHDGRDRDHHPRICYQVTGIPEDASRRGALPLADGNAVATRFCFTGPRGPQYVLYWHYTFEPATDPATLSPLQRLHVRSRTRMPSVTVEVFTNARTAADLQRVGEFAALVDRALRQGPDGLPPLLPATARPGSDTLPIRVVREPTDGLSR